MLRASCFYGFAVVAGAALAGCTLSGITDPPKHDTAYASGRTWSGGDVTYAQSGRTMTFDIGLATIDEQKGTISYTDGLINNSAPPEPNRWSAFSLDLGGPPALGERDLGAAGEQICAFVDLDAAAVSSESHCAPARGTIDVRTYTLDCADSYYEATSDSCGGTKKVCGSIIDMTVTLDSTGRLPVSGTFEVHSNKALVHTETHCM